MKTVIQRVKSASVTIDGKVHGQIEQGYMILVGIQNEDTPEIIEKMAAKIINLRVFEDEQGKMNRNLFQAGGAVLSISQFTLYADCHKGNRPSFDKAGEPVHAKEMYLLFNKILREQGVHVEEGIFGADMKVELINDGPVTILLDSDVDIRH
jgi:D-tyrosyl-tRNA(Tyr) deacylase